MLKIVQITTDNREHSKDYTATSPYFGAAPQALLEGFSGIEDVEIHVVGCSRKPMDSPSKLAKNVYFHSVFVPKRGWMSSLYLGCSLQIRKLCEELEPDVVHGQGSERECAITAVRSGYPNVITIHGNVKELHRLKMFGAGLYGPMASYLESHALRRTSGVFCNSEYTRKLVAPRARHTWLVPNAIRSKFFAPPSSNGKRNIPTLVNIGLIGPRKRQLELLRMVGRIVKSGRQIHVVFAGVLSDGNEYGASFSSEVKKAESEGYATFAGFLEIDPLLDLLDSSHGFLHFPSEEAFGLVVAESLARGLKFFGANLGGIVDIAANVDGAELFDDLQSLESGICKWLDAGAPVPKDAAKHIVNRYHPRVVAQTHLEIYQEILQ